MLYKIERAIKNLSNIVDIKLEKCDVCKEYSVIVLYKDDSDIIICDSGRDAETLYRLLTQRVNSQNQKRLEREEETAIES